jgi:hypothetical protein
MTQGVSQDLIVVLNRRYMQDVVQEWRTLQYKDVR